MRFNLLKRETEHIGKITTTKKRVVVISLVVVLLILSATMLACCTKKHYDPKYLTDSCELKVKDLNTSNEFDFDKVYSKESVEIYLGSDIKDVKTIDFLIENSIGAYSLIKSNTLLKTDFTVIISDNFVSNCGINETLGLCISLPSKPSYEEIVSWFLYSQNIESDLPFGVYAGISALLTNSPLCEKFPLSVINKNSIYSDLQFPLYEIDNLADDERKIAFSFAKRLIEDLLSDNKTYIDILSMSKDDLSSFLSEKYGVCLPEYSFEPYSKEYEYKVKQGCFTYYINREYNDIILPADVFSTKYSVLTDWLKDNAKTTKESDEVFNISNMYDINVYLDDGLKSTGITGYAYSDYINMYSVGSFSHEYIHHILFYLGKSGYAREVIPEMHASTSKYAMAMWYYLFTGQAKNFPYNKEVKEKETYLQTLTLYKKYKVKTPTVDDFDFWLFADCFSAIYTEKGTTFIHRVQTDSLAYYIARVYGTNYVWQINMNTQIVIEGKPYLDVVDEWYNYIKSLNH